MTPTGEIWAQTGLTGESKVAMRLFSLQLVHQSLLACVTMLTCACLGCQALAVRCCRAAGLHNDFSIIFELA